MTDVLLPPKALASGRTRIMLALLVVWDRDGRASIRAVADEAGVTLTTAYDHLRRLRKVGLVDWEDGKAGTLRPLVARVG